MRTLKYGARIPRWSAPRVVVVSLMAPLWAVLLFQSLWTYATEEIWYWPWE